MRGARVTVPKISPVTRRFFGRYADWYVRKNVHAVRLVRSGFDVRFSNGPLIVCLNHPSWWDPLVAAMLAFRLLPSRRHYAPIEAAMLNRYRIFERLGFFGVEPGTASGAARFLRTGLAILNQPDAVLWVTAQGEFTDVRKRPVQLRSGVGHLAAHLPSVQIVPLALEYPFWEERFPEALCAFGQPVPLPDRQPAAVTTAVSAALEASMDGLARGAISRDRDAFDVLVSGSAGVGGVYDLWRRLSSRVRGESFRREHGAERV